MFRRLRSSVILLLLVPGAALAQGRFEITPTASYNFGGTIDASDTELFDFDLEAADSEAFGVTFGIPVAPWAQIELLASRQSTELEFDHGLFGNEQGIADFDVTYYHVGGLFAWGSGQIHPFVVASLGVTELDPDVAGASSETRFSGSLGGGVKIYFNQHFGLRLEGRGFWTALDDYENDYYDDDYCCYDSGCGCGYDNGFTQFQASAGLIFAF
jgi:hypothetical protein